MEKLSSRALSYIIGNGVMVAITTAVVALRFYVRIKHTQRKLWWDDFFLLASLIFALTFGIFVNFSMAYYGWDRHIWDIPVHKLSATYKTYLVGKELFILASSSVRQSLLCFYLWLIRDQGNSNLRRTINACIIVNGVMCFVFCLVCVLECQPVSAFWTFPKPEGSKCVDDGVVTAIAGAFLSLIDIIINVLPLAIVARLRVPFRQRVSVAVLLSLGAIATLAGVVREIWVYKAFIATTDSTYEALPLWICADVEIYVSLICACVPALKPLYSSIKLQSPHSSSFFLLRRSFTRKGRITDLETGPDIDLDDCDTRKIFDGTTATTCSTMTHISASQATRKADSVLEKTKVFAGHSRKDSQRSNIVGIQVETRIELSRTVSSQDLSRTCSSSDPY